MRLRIACSPAGIDLLRSPWERLYFPDRHTVFQSFAWNRLAAEAFADRERPYVVYAENATGAAIIPAAVTASGITLLGETLFDYRDVLVAGDGGALSAAWRELAALELPFSVAGLRGAADEWRAFDLRPFSEAPFVPAQDIQEHAAHSRAGRLVRRLERLDAGFRRYDGSSAALLRSIYRRKAVQFGAENLFTDPRRVDFMVRVLALAPAAVDVFTFETAGEIIAALVTLRDGNVRRFYTTWFDNAWAHQSPGTALLFEVTSQSLAEGLDCDYMTGAQPHKLRFRTASLPLFRAKASAEQLARIASEQAEMKLAA